jgi:hypothetical protein
VSSRFNGERAHFKLSDSLLFFFFRGGGNKPYKDVLPHVDKKFYFEITAAVTLVTTTSLNSSFQIDDFLLARTAPRACSSTFGEGVQTSYYYARGLLPNVLFRCFREIANSDYDFHRVRSSVCPHGITRLPLDGF